MKPNRIHEIQDRINIIRINLSEESKRQGVVIDLVRIIEELLKEYEILSNSAQRSNLVCD